MKIAEALTQIKDLKGKVAKLTRHASYNGAFEVLDESQEVPSIEETLVELEDSATALSNLKTRVTKTNAANGLTDKINEMERLRSLVSNLDNLTLTKQDTVSLRHISYDQPPAPVHTFATYDVEALTNKVDTFRARIREIDLELQRRNWEVDLAN